MTTLGGHGGLIEDGVGVVHRAHDERRINGVSLIERDVEGFGRLVTLESRNVVGERRRSRARETSVVPTRTSPLAAGHERGIRVQCGDVGLVGNRSQDLTLRWRGVGEEGEGLVRVTGQDHVIEVRRHASGGHVNTLVDASHCGNATGQSNGITEFDGNCVDVLHRSAHHGAPLRAIGQRE